MALTIALTSPETRPAIVTPVTRKSRIIFWLETLEYFENEVNFYRKLLAIGLHNCATPVRAEVKNLLLDFNRFEQIILPGLKAEARSFKNVPNDAIFEFVSFDKKLIATGERLKEMKKLVFPLYTHLNRVVIR